MVSRKNIAQSLRGSLFVLGYHTPFRPFRALSSKINLWVSDSAFNYLQICISRIWIGQSWSEEIWLETEGHPNLISGRSYQPCVREEPGLISLPTRTLSQHIQCASVEWGDRFWLIILTLHPLSTVCLVTTTQSMYTSGRLIRWDDSTLKLEYSAKCASSSGLHTNATFIRLQANPTLHIYTTMESRTLSYSGVP